MRSRENQVVCSDGGTQFWFYFDQRATRRLVLRKQRAFQGKIKTVVGGLQHHVGAVKAERVGFFRA